MRMILLISQLLSYSNNIDALHTFTKMIQIRFIIIIIIFLPNYKKWCLKYLEKKWLKSLPPLKFASKKIERLDSNFNPHLYYDHEQYFEILVKFKEVIANHQKRRKKIYLRKQSSEQLKFLEY